VRLEVQALARGVRGDEDPQRVLLGIRVEPTLDLLALGPGREAVDDLDALLGEVSPLDRLFEHLLEVALRALAVLREDEDPPVVPYRRMPLDARAEGRQSRAHVVAHPLEELEHLRVGLVARLLGDVLHAVEKGLLLAPHGLGSPISGGSRLQRFRDCFDLRDLVCLKLLTGELCPLVVGVGRAREQARLVFGD